MSQSKTAFERIHNLNPTLARLFSWPLYVAAWVVVVLYAVLPYSLRLLVAGVINICFNRPMVYLNYLGRLIGQPMSYVTTTVIYLVVFGAYALFMVPAVMLRRLKPVRSTWVEAPPATAGMRAFFQS